MHMMLPNAVAATALARGWGVMHPISDDISGESTEYVMIFGPGNDAELGTLWIIAQVSYYYARGISMESGTTAVTPATLGPVKSSVRCCLVH